MLKRYRVILLVIVICTVGYLIYKPENNILNIISTFESQNTEVAAHRVNTPKKISELKSKGIKNIEIDVFSDDGLLIVGHEKETSSDIPLVNYFEIINNMIPDFDFIWLDMKDLTTENEQEHIKVLSMLDKQYNIKDRVFIESRYPEALKELSKEGWNTGYYLRYELSDQPQEYVQQVLQELSDNNIKAITFPCDHIDYAQKHFKNRDNTISLNCWTFKRKGYREKDYQQLEMVDRLLISVKTKNNL